MRWQVRVHTTAVTVSQASFYPSPVENAASSFNTASPRTVASDGCCLHRAPQVTAARAPCSQFDSQEGTHKRGAAPALAAGSQQQP